MCTPLSPVRTPGPGYRSCPYCVVVVVVYRPQPPTVTTSRGLHPPGAVGEEKV